MNLSRIAFLLLAATILSIVLAEIYRPLGIALDNRWLGAAIVNTAAAIWIYIHFRRSPAPEEFAVPVPETVSQRIRRQPLWLYLPAAIVVLFAIIAPWVSSQISPRVGMPAEFDIQFEQLAWILWIPIIEEIVFRLGIGRFFREQGGWFFGSYISALLFSLVHSDPTIERFTQGSIGLPLGPFLLGWATEGILMVGHRLGPLIAFHAACNATPILFNAIDDRWLSWLHYLY